MARTLGDVLHHFAPELGAASLRPIPSPKATPPAEAKPPRVVAVALERGDLLRAAVLWNLAVETARAGAECEALVPVGTLTEAPGDAAPLGVGLIAARCEPGETLADVARRRARDAARAPADADAQRLAMVGVPATDAGRLCASVDLALLVCGCDPASRSRFEAVGRHLLRSGSPPPGIIIHGARTLDEARRAFEAVACPLEHVAGEAIPSYGLLVDDLALYRSVVERCPVGLARPQSPAAQALADVAALLAADLGLR